MCTMMRFCFSNDKLRQMSVFALNDCTAICAVLHIVSSAYLPNLLHFIV